MLNLQTDVIMHVVDISQAAFHMCYVQLALKGVPAQVIHGNTLTLETFTSDYTPAGVYFIGKHGFMFPPMDQLDFGKGKKPEQR